MILVYYSIIAKTTCFTSGCRRAVEFTVRPLSFAKPIEQNGMETITLSGRGCHSVFG